MKNKQERLNKLAEGYIKRIHVDKHVIARNRKHGTNDPAYTIQTSAGPLKAHQIFIDGPSWFVPYSEKALSCGARIWLETKAEVRIELE